MSNETSILAVIVLYGQRPEESVAWKALQQAAAYLPGSLSRFEVLLYDNSPSVEGPVQLPHYAAYHGAAANSGLSGAYSYALAQAEKKASDWLLTMDQDTDLPADFLERLGTYGGDLSRQAEIGAVVPQLSEGGILLSPRRVRLGRTKAVPRGFTGIAREEIHAFNSGALWRVSALRQVGGFSPYFRLDHLDIWMFHQLYRAGFSVFIAGDLQLPHTLSLLDYSTRVSDRRYADFLAAESAFCDMCLGPVERALLTARLGCRLLVQRRRGERSAIRALTARAIRDRITLSRRERVRRWSTAARENKVAEIVEESRRQRISVCLAAFNGERYIAAQLRSITDQLSGEDEVVIVDDGSTDHTREEIRKLGDERIRVIQHHSRQGILQTFEDAIRAAGNEIIFLSDQDDLWLPEKVRTILSVFADDPEVELVTSNVKLIDSADQLLDEPDPPQSRPFGGGFWATLLRNQYRGCTMAFRATLRGEILPLPKNYDVLHDVWIGMRTRLSCRKSVHLTQPLMLYRRHSTTVTGRTRLDAFRKAQNRANLLTALGHDSIRRMMGPPVACPSMATAEEDRVREDA